EAGRGRWTARRSAHGELTLERAAELGCRACGSPGGGCQFLGTAGTSQVVGGALGLTLPHAALAPSGPPLWRDLATPSARAAQPICRDLPTRSARALLQNRKAGLATKQVLTPGAAKNAMAVHAA